jgi:hypothetical protein
MTCQDREVCNAASTMVRTLVSLVSLRTEWGASQRVTRWECCLRDTGPPLTRDHPGTGYLSFSVVS